MNKFPQYINVIETVEVNGYYLEEYRGYSERRKTLKLHFNCYERRLQKHRRHSVQIDIQV
jgi:hypothetical protein